MPATLAMQPTSTIRTTNWNLVGAMASQRLCSTAPSKMCRAGTVGRPHCTCALLDPLTIWTAIHVTPWLVTFTSVNQLERSHRVFACHSTSGVVADSYYSGLNGWYLPNNSGLEYMGVSNYNSTYTGFRYALTYISEPALYYQDTVPNMLTKLDTFPLNASRFKEEVSYVFSYLSSTITPSIYGTPSLKNLTGITTTVCVYNCGVLPWKFSRAYATTNSTAVTVPYQRFSMLFCGINTYDFQTNNHVSFDRDSFQLR